MARSVSCRFFLTPEETVDVVETVVSSSGLRVFVQLRRPGEVLEPMAAVSDILSRSETPTRLLLTHRELPAGTEPGTFDGFGVPGLISVSVPFVEGDRFYLGSAGAKFVEDRDPDAVAARALVRRFKRSAPLNVSGRNVKSGATGPATGVGCSQEAVRFAEDNGLRFRQFAVDNIEYMPLGR